MQRYLENAETVLEELQTSKTGLTADEAAKRLEANGRNKLAQPPRDSWLKRFLKSLADPMIIMLLCAAAVSAATTVYQNVVRHQHESYADLFIILFVVVVNTVLSMVQESKAEQAIDSLMEMTAETSRVVRDGAVRHRSSKAKNWCWAISFCWRPGIPFPLTAAFLRATA